MNKRLQELGTQATKGEVKIQKYLMSLGDRCHRFGMIELAAECFKEAAMAYRFQKLKYVTANEIEQKAHKLLKWHNGLILGYVNLGGSENTAFSNSVKIECTQENVARFRFMYDRTDELLTQKMEYTFDILIEEVHGDGHAFYEALIQGLKGSYSEEFSFLKKVEYLVLMNFLRDNFVQWCKSNLDAST